MPEKTVQNYAEGPADKFTLSNLPPEGDDAVADFAYRLYQSALNYRDQQGLPERWISNYTLYRGDHWQREKMRKNRNKMTVNLFFANVNRTVANITAREPKAEVVDLDGLQDDSEHLWSSKLVKWWKDYDLQKILRTSALKMEKYGITIEKGLGNDDYSEPEVIVVDPFAFLPAPGFWADISYDPPFLCHINPEYVEAMEAKYGLEENSIEAEDVFTVLGYEREEKRPKPIEQYGGRTVQYDSGLQPVGNPAGRETTSEGMEYTRGKGLEIEVWVRDYSTVTDHLPAKDPNTGEINPNITVPVERLKYPGGIRVITITKARQAEGKTGYLVLDDKANPNVNPVLPDEVAMKSFFYDRFPFWKANSYEDTTSIWGFSAAEQVADLNYKIDEIFSRIVAYMQRAMFPPLVIPASTGIRKEQINTKPNLLLSPADDGKGIRFVDVPRIPVELFTGLETLLSFYDRVYQIEDADRGLAPKGVTAASAIVALQERNAVLIQHKIKAVDHLVEMRGKFAMSFYQNFGVKNDTVDVQGDPVMFRGVQFAGREYNYVVESGSTVPKTSLQIQEQAVQLYQLGAIDRQALLESLNFPNWKEVVERVGEGMLNQALQVLIQAGLPEEEAMALHQFLIENQGGPGNDVQKPKSSVKEVSPPGPKGKQGQMPPGSVVSKQDRRMPARA